MHAVNIQQYIFVLFINLKKLEILMSCFLFVVRVPVLYTVVQGTLISFITNCYYWLLLSITTKCCCCFTLLLLIVVVTILFVYDVLELDNIDAVKYYLWLKLNLFQDLSWLILIPCNFMLSFLILILFQGILWSVVSTDCFPLWCKFVKEILISIPIRVFLIHQLW